MEPELTDTLRVIWGAAVPAPHHRASQRQYWIDPQLLTADFQSYVLALTETFKFDFNFYIFMMALFKSAMINIFNEENYFG